MSAPEHLFIDAEKFDAVKEDFYSHDHVVYVREDVSEAFVMLNCLGKDAPDLPEFDVDCIVAVDNGNGGIEYMIGKYIAEDGSFRIPARFGSVSLFPRYVIRNTRKPSVYAYKEFKMI